MYIKTLLFFVICLKIVQSQHFELEQVLILSRHNVRTPLSKNLFEFTPKNWPLWKEKNGFLTPKGVLLEGYMGEFFSSWLKKEGLLTEMCPDEKSFYVYANNVQRTLASAEAFISKAFPLCNITIHHSDTLKPDKIFNPVIHNSSKVFKNEALEQMLTLLNSLHVNKSFVNLEEILDYKESKYCTLKHKCNFITDKNKLFVNPGFKPNLEGPLKISKSVIDSFIMENYEGFPMDMVAWGMLRDTDKWTGILDLTRGYHNIIFNTTIIAQDVAKPLLKFLMDLLLNKRSKITLLMAHDANIYTVLKSMGFHPYILKHQYELTPVGGKLVFQKWMDKNLQKFYVKIDYVYQGTEQMREGRKLSLVNPPEFKLLEMTGCEIDGNGFCLWNKFINLLRYVGFRVYIRRSHPDFEVPAKAKAPKAKKTAKPPTKKPRAPKPKMAAATPKSKLATKKAAASKK